MVFRYRKLSEMTATGNVADAIQCIVVALLSYDE